MNGFEYIAIIAISAIIIFEINSLISDYYWRKKPLHNFPFKYRGKEFWYSRSVATTCAVFAKNKEEEWCVLANKRGEGTPDFQGYWNLVCGYLEFDFSGEENAQKEIFEECGLLVPLETIKFYSLNTSPKQNRQNVSITYTSILEDYHEKYTISSENSEEDEVSEIKFIPIKDIDNYQWAFNHLSTIKDMIKNNVITMGVEA